MSGIALMSSAADSLSANAEPPTLGPLDLAEFSLLAAGVVILMIGGLLLAALRRMGDFFSLPAPPENQLGVLDFAVALWMFALVPLLVAKVIGAVAPLPPPASMPAASSPVDMTTTVATQPADQAVSIVSRDGDARTASAPAEVAPPTPRTLRDTVPMVASQLLLAVLLAGLGASRFGGLASWGLSARRLARDLWLAPVIYAATWPICSALLWLCTLLLTSMYGLPLYEHSSIATLLSPLTPHSVRLLTAVSAVVLAPIVEEVAFRGLLLPGLVKATRSPWLGIGASALIFGMIHAPVPQTVPSLVVFGAVLGFVYLKTRSLTLVVLIHAVFNAKTVLWIFLAGPGTQ